jgi:hypothetical protein
VKTFTPKRSTSQNVLYQRIRLQVGYAICNDFRASALTMHIACLHAHMQEIMGTQHQIAGQVSWARC